MGHDDFEAADLDLVRDLSETSEMNSASLALQA